MVVNEGIAEAVSPCPIQCLPVRIACSFGVNGLVDFPVSGFIAKRRLWQFRLEETMVSGGIRRIHRQGLYLYVLTSVSPSICLSVHLHLADCVHACHVVHVHVCFCV